ncbi:HEAT repeat domain-containing protein [Larkinella terrae]|uniref:HEAT repeat domain-containing protein n=1 Tax=Larkinella terrae TaxID=2025311 RepID=A0A7K0EFZ5_9BACT|nr:HEAT repeat domain-containing protein [Larkinella terrae]MRS60368.1 HEAT repeat domain-containing protein [Larkinella terrae]
MKQDIEKLLEKYYAGESTLEEEKQLRDFFQGPSVPAHLASQAGPFRYYAEARAEQPSLTVNKRLTDQLSSESRVRSLTTWSLRIAASVALLAGGFAGGLYYSNRFSDQLNPTETSSALAIKKVLDFDQSAQTSASERIQAVNQSYELPEASQDITQLLINTMNFDENVNVRLAACQALTRLSNETGVREALIQSLKIQTDPYLQIMLIETLVSIQEKRAVDEMQRLARNRQILEAVRLKAEEGLNRLTQPQNRSAS